MMKLCLVGSGSASPGKALPFTLKFDHIYVDRFYRHLTDDPTLCTGCGLNCDHCRSKFPLLYPVDFKKDIATFVKLPGTMPYYIDDPREYFPNLPSCDVMVAVAVHEDILLALPKIAAAAGAKLLIVPVEDPDWLSKWVRGRLRQICQSLNIECAFPKPFCALQAEGSKVVQEFMDYFRLGYPEVKLKIKDDLIVESQVIHSAPCGCTYYVSRNLIGVNVKKDNIEKVVAKYWHSYPCVASMKMDPDLGDTILHKGGYIHYDIVHDAIAKAELISG